jgi:hypothetical protein
MTGANIISAIHSLKIAQEHFADFRREYPTSAGAKLFKVYEDKIDWIFRDFLSHPHLDDRIREGIKAEINSDVFSVPAISEKVTLLDPEQRDMIEKIIDAVLADEHFQVINK